MNQLLATAPEGGLLALNQLLTTVLAVDNDLNDVITFSITSGNDDGGLSINANGEVRVADASVFDFATTPVRTYTLTATDSTTRAVNATFVLSSTTAFAMEELQTPAQNGVYALSLQSPVTFVSWTLNWGDGTPSETFPAGSGAIHTYQSPGAKSITASVVGGGASTIVNLATNIGQDPNVNLLMNGGFEYPYVSNSALWDIYESIPGWSIDSRSAPDVKIEVQRGVVLAAAEGYQSVELDADQYGPNGTPSQNPTGSMAIGQSVATVAGQTYQLSFLLAARPNTSLTENAVNVRVVGNATDIINQTFNAASSGWTRQTITFVANSASTRIILGDAGASSNGQGTLVDDVQLYPYQSPNLPPTAVDDLIVVDGATASITATQLLQNDTDPENDTLSFTSIITSPTHGQLVSSGTNTWVYQPDTGFQGTDSFRYKITDGRSYSSTTVQLLMTNAATPKGWLLVARPNTKNIQAELVPHDESSTSGVYIRRNGDDDDRDELWDNDATETSVAGENDTLALKLQLDRFLSDIQSLGYDVILRRSSDAVQLWTSQTKGSPLFVGGNDYQLPAAPNAKLYDAFAEWKSLDKGIANATIQLIFKKTGAETVVDSLVLKPFNSIVIGYVGEFQQPGDDNGMSQIIASIYKRGYDAYIYDEDDMVFDRDVLGNVVEIGADLLSPLADPPETSFKEVENAITRRGVTHVSLLGYSHGGGAAYVLASNMLSRLPENSYELDFTGYIDAIEKQSLLAQEHAPIGSQHHFNIFQKSLGTQLGFKGIEGTSINDDGMVFNDDVDSPDALVDGLDYVDDIPHSTRYELVFVAGIGFVRQPVRLGIAEQPLVQEALLLYFDRYFMEK